MQKCILGGDDSFSINLTKIDHWLRYFIVTTLAIDSCMVVYSLQFARLSDQNTMHY